MKWVYRILSILIAIPIISFIFIFGGAILVEGKNPFFPYIDTEFAPKYTPEKFDLITKDFTYEKVIDLLGEPLYENYDSFYQGIRLDYTNDGNLRRINKRNFDVKDFAWYRSIIYFDLNCKIVNIEKGWSYD